MRCLVTDATREVGSLPDERWRTDGHEVGGMDACIDYYARQMKAQNLSITARSWAHFTFIFGSIEKIYKQLQTKKLLVKSLIWLRGLASLDMKLCKYKYYLNGISASGKGWSM
jgi:hypothetical protein